MPGCNQSCPRISLSKIYLRSCDQQGRRLARLRSLYGGRVFLHIPNTGVGRFAPLSGPYDQRDLRPAALAAPRALRAERRHGQRWSGRGLLRRGQGPRDRAARRPRARGRSSSSAATVLWTCASTAVARPDHRGPAPGADVILTPPHESASGIPGIPVAVDAGLVRWMRGRIRRLILAGASRYAQEGFLG